jgi:transposase
MSHMSKKATQQTDYAEGIVYERCCGIDVHKKSISACLIANGKKEIRTYGTMTGDLEDMMEWLKSHDCQAVGMESTGVYWKPVYNVLEEGGMKTIVCNAQHIKNVPGRKTDVKDAEWIARVTRLGLVQPSYVPDKEDRELREIVRYRRNIVQERARELNRIQNVLEGANIKLTNVISDISDKSGISILKAIMGGETDPEKLYGVTTGKLKAGKETLVAALKGCIGLHQMQMIKLQLGHIEELDKIISEMDEIVKKKQNPEKK